MAGKTTGTKVARYLGSGIAAASLLLASGIVDIDPLIVTTGQAKAQQTGSPGGSGNQGTGTGPGSTARTSNQNRAGGGNGGGSAGGVPSPSSMPDTGGMTTQHDMTPSVVIASGWCDDVGSAGVAEEQRLTGKNAARLDSALSHLGGAPQGVSAAERTKLLAAYQRAMEATPQQTGTAAEALAVATTGMIDAGTVVDVNALLCVSAPDAQVVAIAEAAQQKQAGMAR